jgi:hypothetical protein
VAWSLSQPSVIFFSDETGKMQAWDITSKKSEPFQTQDISGRTINGESDLVKNIYKFIIYKCNFLLQ